jgi:predicted RNase H-like nuclease (RuvC/YqgF family)|tara:strand:- start:255 stop:428 length:174 start_codon:yes stop_codon:yes gene_type:complete
MDIYKQQIKEEAKEINLLRKRITELNSKVSILEKKIGQYKKIQLVVENPDASHIKDE